MTNTNQLNREAISIKDSENGIVKWNTGDEEYTFWTYADFIKPHIIDFLKDRFPGKLVVRELNKIDLSVPEENLPIEIQATPIEVNNCPHYSVFEQDIEKQINQNITSYHRCWFFFDSELLRSMQDSVNRRSSISINMVWFRNYIKEGKLKVFTVSHDGIFEEKEYKDFDFLSEISQTCSIAAKTDGAILNDNKMKIYTNVVKMYNFTQSEIEKFYDDWREYCKLNNIESTDRNDKMSLFLIKQKDKRPNLYGYILNAIGNLPAINDILGLKNYNKNAKRDASMLGIFDVEGRVLNAITRFTDRSNVCQYIPGYIRNKETWDKLKGHSLNPRQFESIVKNGINNYFWYEKCSDQNNIDVKSEQINDKEVEVKIENKDQIITVTVKTEQKNIDDSWGY